MNATARVPYVVGSDPWAGEASGEAHEPRPIPDFSLTHIGPRRRLRGCLYAMGRARRPPERYSPSALPGREQYVYILLYIVYIYIYMLYIMIFLHRINSWRDSVCNDVDGGWPPRGC
jgi:hypothetical protein